ncbi:MAG: hypothetical protein HeimC2_42340, partial [Candidatus Heimdallarchaeota archaeon LC_2]
LKRGKAKSMALVAVAAKILRCCFYILRDGVDYDPARLERRDSHPMQKQMLVAPLQV